MGNSKSVSGGSDKNDGEGTSLLSILFEVAAYGQPISPEARSGFIDRCYRSVATEDIEIGDGLHIKVNGLKDWSGRAD